MRTARSPTVKLLVVAGMHRSGTSFASELLHEAGIGVGDDLLPAAEDNPHGFWEHRDIKRINDQVLERLGGTWDDPPTALPPTWADGAGLDQLRNDARRALVELIDAVADAPGLVVKDPRLSITSDLWLTVCEPAASFVMLRDPDLVAYSLRHRDGMSAARSARLWLRYTVDALLDLPNPFVVDLAALAGEPRATLQAMVKHAGLDVDIAAAVDVARQRSRTLDADTLLDGHPKRGSDANSLARGLHRVLVDGHDLDDLRPMLERLANAWRLPPFVVGLQHLQWGTTDDALTSSLEASRTHIEGLEAKITEWRLLAEERRRERDQERRQRRSVESSVTSLESQLERAQHATRDLAETRALVQDLTGRLQEAEEQLGYAEGRAARFEEEVRDRLPTAAPPRNFAAEQELARLKNRRSVRAATKVADLLGPAYRSARQFRQRLRPGPKKAETDEESSPAGSPGHTEDSTWSDLTGRLGKAPSLTVVVPIYNATEDVRACIDHIRRWTPGSIEILLIDDASTDPELAPILVEAATIPNTTVLRNEINLGFTGTVNRGFRETKGDVIILNSDARVTPNWSMNLRVAAYSDDRVATVSAVSDNAGAFSVPEPGPNPSTGLDEQSLARLMTRRSRRRWLETPTGHGFCMYVRRAALDELEGFDVESFPRGYGEENDFCMRALKAGWTNLVDDATLVFHANAASFDPERKAELVAAGRARVDELHPDYTRRIRTFLRGDMQLVRADARQVTEEAREIAGTEAQGSSLVRPRLLSVVQEGAGGTPKTNRDLMHALAPGWDTWILTSDSRTLRLSRVTAGQQELVEEVAIEDRLGFNTPTHPRYREFIARILIELGIEVVHVRHLFKHTQDDLVDLLRTLAIPAVLSFHDFYFVCPNIHLLDEDNRYCGGRCTAGPGDCSYPDPGEPLPVPLKHHWVHGWKERSGNMLGAFDAFVTTSGSARDILIDNLPDLAPRSVTVIPHGRDLRQVEDVAAPPDPPVVRIAVIGSLSAPKGGDFLRELLRHDRDAVLDFHVVGPHDPAYDDLRVTFHGRYQRDELTAVLAAIRPNFGAVLSVWPETWSHTLTEAWSHGLPVLTSQHGALGERVRDRGGGWVLDVNDPASAYRRILEIAADPDEWLAQRRAANIAGLSTTSHMADSYDEVYATARRRRAPGFPVVEVHIVANPRGGAPGSAHVRSLRRFRHPDVRRGVHAHAPVLNGPALDKVGPPNLLWVQRNAVPVNDLADLLRRRADRDLALVVDLDDDLVHADQLPPQMAAYVPSMRRLVAEADLVTVSTQRLADVVEPMARRVEVLPNQLDERLWFPAGVIPRLRTAPGDNLDVLYMGTTTHGADLDMLEEPFRAFARSHDGTVRLHVIGGRPTSASDRWFERIPVPSGTTQYPAFVPWLRSLAAQFDFAVAPLADTPFTAAKSDLKFLEYAAMGLPGVFSDSPAYRDTITHGVDGRISANTTDAWEANLAAMADAEHRAGLAAAAGRTVNLRTIGATAEDFIHLLDRETRS